MKIFITEYDRHNAFKAALLTIARFHDITNYEFMSNNELYHEIKQISSPLIEPLNAYLKAYNKWFEFYSQRKKIEEETEEEYELNAMEKGELASLVSERQNSLDRLQAQFNSLRK